MGGKRIKVLRDIKRKSSTPVNIPNRQGEDGMNKSSLKRRRSMDDATEDSSRSNSNGSARKIKRKRIQNEEY